MNDVYSHLEGGEVKKLDSLKINRDPSSRRQQGSLGDNYTIDAANRELGSLAWQCGVLGVAVVSINGGLPDQERAVGPTGDTSPGGGGEKAPLATSSTWPLFFQESGVTTNHDQVSKSQAGMCDKSMSRENTGLTEAYVQISK